jgi:hypothetical protein
VTRTGRSNGTSLILFCRQWSECGVEAIADGEVSGDSSLPVTSHAARGHAMTVAIALSSGLSALVLVLALVLPFNRSST